MPTVETAPPWHALPVGASQVKQFTAPAAEYWPAGHAVQVDVAGDPVYRPAVQLSHATRGEHAWTARHARHTGTVGDARSTGSRRAWKTAAAAAETVQPSATHGAEGRL